MSESPTPTVEELDGSELGTIEYWEKSYVKENKNYKTHGNVGEIWFDEDSQFRIIKWMETRELTDKAIVDLGKLFFYIKLIQINLVFRLFPGCGNGMMLIELMNEGFTNLTGIDYSPNGIELAKSIAIDRDFPNIVYKVGDILSKEFNTEFGQFDVIHDKGNFPPFF